MRTVFSLLALVAVGSLCACAGGKTAEVGYRVIPAPADAIAFSPIGDGRFAILGGNDFDRVVTIERASDGTILQRFGAAKESDAIAARADGTVYLGLSTLAGGAVEEWGSDGGHRRTIPMPGSVVGLAISRSGSLWAFVRARNAFTAVEIPTGSNRAGRSVPLPAGTSSVAYCDGIAEPSLVVSEEARHVMLVRIRDGATTDTTNIGDQPVCSKADQAIYAISRAGDATYLTVVGMRTLLTIKQTPTMRDASSLATNALGELVVLGKGQAASAIRVYARGASDLREQG